MSASMRFLACVALLALLTACERSPPEQRLREAVGSLQDAIQDRDAAAMDAWLADDFVGPDGLDRRGARQLAQVMHMRHRNVGITLGPMQVELQADHATVTFTAVLAGGSGGLLPDTGNVYHVRTGWRLDDDDWRLTSAQWTTAPR